MAGIGKAVSDAVRSVTGQEKKVVLSSDNHTQVMEWKSIYANNAPWLQNRSSKRPNDKQVTTSAEGAEIVCREMAQLLFAEPPAITASEFVTNTLVNNRFISNMLEYTEYMGALGALAIKPYLVKDMEKSTDTETYGDIRLSFVTADRMRITDYDSTGVYGIKFFDYKRHKGRLYCRVESHSFEKQGLYVIENELYEIKNTEQPDDLHKGAFSVSLDILYPDMEARTEIETTKPLFTYIKAPYANKDIGSPYGAAMFGRAYEGIEQLDISCHSMQREIVNGRKRIGVPRKMLEKDPVTGKRNIYNQDTDVYDLFNSGELEDNKPTDFTTELRTEEIAISIHSGLDFLSLHAGFDPGYLTYSSGGIKTKYEVRTNNKKTMRTRGTWIERIDQGMIELNYAIQKLGQHYGLEGSKAEPKTDTQKTVIEDGIAPIKLQWDDSVMDTKEERVAHIITLHDAKLISTVEALKRIHEVDEAAAKKMIQEITAGTRTAVDPLDVITTE